MNNDVDRAIVITGSTGGLGPVLVRRLLDDYRCAVLYRSEASWQALQGELGASERLRGYQADLRDEDAVNRAVKQALADFGNLYGLVNVAAGFETGSVAETSLDAWRRQLDTNLTTAFVAIRAILPHLLQRGAGRIVAFGSAAALGHPGGMAGYVVGKAALNVLIDSLAKELRGTGVTANTILPGSLDTPAMREHMSRDKLVPLDRIAATVNFLLSDDAGSVTGASIPVTGTR